MGKSKDGNVTCFMYTQMRIVGLVLSDPLIVRQNPRQTAPTEPRERLQTR